MLIKILDFQRQLLYKIRSTWKREGVRVVVNNLLWLGIDKCVRLLLALGVGVWLARYLGPDQYGQLNYALAVVTIFTAISSLGLNPIVVRDLVDFPSEKDNLLGTAFVLQLVGAFFASLCSVGYVLFAKPNEADILCVVSVLSLSFFFKSVDVIKYWYEARVESKKFVRVDLVVFLIFSCLRIAMIISGASLLAFASVLTLESFFSALAIFYIYKINGGFLSYWRWCSKRCKRLFRDTWPMIFSGLAVSVYMRVDQLILGDLLGNRAVGVYSAAVRMTEIWYMVPMMIAGTVFPYIIKAKSVNSEIYNERLSLLFTVMGGGSIVVALVTSAFSDEIILTLYGDSYVEAAKVLSIQVWSGVFVFSGIIAGRWFLAERLQSYLLLRSLSGGFANVFLNFLLIPKFGLIGAAWAGLLSNAISGVLINGFFERTRFLFSMQIRGLFLVRLFLKNKK